jgi:hypothetical protein
MLCWAIFPRLAVLHWKAQRDFNAVDFFMVPLNVPLILTGFAFFGDVEMSVPKHPYDIFNEDFCLFVNTLDSAEDERGGGIADCRSDLSELLVLGYPDEEGPSEITEATKPG